MKTKMRFAAAIAFAMLTSAMAVAQVNETDPRYLSAAKNAVDRLLAAGKIFEVNTGAIARGYRAVPYPAPTLFEYIRGMDGRLMLASDAHTPEKIAFAFDRIVL